MSILPLTLMLWAALQGTPAPDPAALLAEARAAMGGAALAAVRTWSASGTSTHVSGGSSRSSDIDLALEWPGKFVRTEELANVAGLSVVRTSGVNEGQLINIIDQPMMANGSISVRPIGAGFSQGGVTPARQAELDRAQLEEARADFARLGLGMLAATPPGTSVELAYGGTAQAPDGLADIIDIKSDVITGRLFLDRGTHRPILFSWQDKAPLVMDANGAQVLQGGAAMRTFGQMSDAERQQVMADLEARRLEAEARRRTVEYRLFYRDFKTVDGVTMPTRFTTVIDGTAAAELKLDKFKINPKLNARTFATKK